MTSPVSESVEGYFHSTGGINLEQDEDTVSGMHVYMSCVSMVTFNGGVNKKQLLYFVRWKRGLL